MPVDLTGRDAETDHEAPDRRYSHRPKPFSRELSLRLTHDRLFAERGESAYLVFPLNEVERVRLWFAPRNMAHLAFACEIRRTDGVTLRFDNISWKGLVEVEKQDAAYRAFVSRLVRAVRDAAPAARIEAGIHPLRFRLFCALGVVIALALVALAVHAALSAAWAVAGFAVFLGLYFGWWMLGFARRNRPMLVTGVDLPETILPSLNAPPAPNRPHA